MPNPSDESDASTLPDPELNPLLNPLLAAHMGRWAEVYFTNPPEKRGQAITELLRELENISPPEPSSLPVVSAEADTVVKEEIVAEAQASAPPGTEAVCTCGVCACENSFEQRFCGMCGSPLQLSPEAHEPPVVEAAPSVESGSWQRPIGGNSVEHAIQFAVNPATDHQQSPARLWPLPEKYPPHRDVESQHVAYRYRVYGAGALAILIAVFLYMVWRGSEVLSGSATPPSVSARGLTPAQPAPTTSAQPGTVTALTKSTEPVSRVQDKDKNEDQIDAASRTMQVADAKPAPQIVPVAASSPAAANSSAPAADPSGAEEFAIAEKFLNGSQGATHDSEEAAQWLWKAVKKRNLAATMALSDLYLRGDGVLKNCDQARALLDAAARRGEKAAAERLRNLQAFGCQ